VSELNKLCNDGFSIETATLKESAYISLRIALKSYFKTYKAVENELDWKIVNTDNYKHDDNVYFHYCEYYSETIVHFQHFFELIIKQLLRHEHPLLAVDTGNKHIVLYDLIKEGKASDKDLNNLNSIEFRKALERICRLIKDKKLPNYSNLKFIYTEQQTLIELNKLRNRALHRGTYILKYKSLDQFIGKYILPLVSEFLNLDEVQNKPFTWKYTEPFCKIVVIEDIIVEASRGCSHLNYCRYIFQ
jgi:hypothetical protein